MTKPRERIRLMNNTNTWTKLLVLGFIMLFVMPALTYASEQKHAAVAHGEHRGGHVDSQGGGHEGHDEHIYTSQTTDLIGEIALAFLGLVLVALAISIPIENK